MQSQRRAGVGMSSIEIKVSFLSPVTAGGETLEVRGESLRVGHATTSLALMRRE